MSRIATLAVGTATSLALIAGSLTTAQAAPLPARSAVQLAGDNAMVDHVRYRGYGYGYGYRRGGGRAAGALAAGAALGLIGGAIAASAAPRYGYYDYGYAPASSYGYGYAPSYGSGYAPAYGYGYAPASSYGYGYGYAPSYYGYGW